MKAAFTRAPLAQRSLLTLALAAALLVAPVQAQQPRQSEVDLQAAIRTQTIDGDLKAAIAQYAAIAKKYEKSDRATTAQALVHMAECYQKQGDAEAKKIYERVVREFGDQTNAVATARARLGTEIQLQARGNRVVWSGPEIYEDARVSRDGRFISYTDWEASQNLFVYNVATGAHRPVGNRERGNSYSSTFSRDGRQLAYGWRTYSTPQHINELRIVTLDGTVFSQPRKVFGDEEVHRVSPYDWSPSGESIAVLLERHDRSKQIGLVSARDGSYRGLRTVGWRGPIKMFFSPDGKYLAYDLPATDASTQRDVFVLAADGMGETHIVDHPAHDVVMGWSTDGSQLLFASNRNGPTGLWALPFSNGKRIGDPALLKPDIGVSTSLGLTSSGTLYVLKDVSTSRLQLVPVDLTVGKVVGPAIVENYVQPAVPAWSKDGKSLAYASIDSSGILTLFIRSIQSKELRKLRPSLSYFQFPQWMPDGNSLMMFGRDLNGRSGIYRVDAKTGGTSLVTESLTTGINVSPDGKKIYYNVDKFGPSGRPGKYIERDLASGTVRVVFQDPFWGPKLSPDGRYLTRVFTEKGDSVIRLVPVSGGEESELFRVPGVQGAFGHGVCWTPDGRALVTAGDAGVLVIPVDGGEIRKLDVDFGPFGGVTVSPDGKHVATNTGKSLREIWALENFLPTQTASNK